MAHRFLQLHFLTSYPGTLLNRDDAGFAKRLPFGGAVRTRISSQCLKRHWRTFEGEHSLRDLGVPMAIRSRLTFERYVLTPLVDSGVDEALAAEVVEALMKEVLGQSPKAAKKKKDEEDTAPSMSTGQITVLGRPEVDWILAEARAVCAVAAGEADAKARKKAVAGAVKDRLGKKGEGRKNLQALQKAAGLDAALFGRMVTSDILSRGDAAVHVAHAFTVHTEETEADYFSAVDDLLGSEGELGSGHIGTTELTSGLFYGYVVVDIPLLISNLEGCPAADWQQADRTLAAQLLARLTHLVATVSPGAKLGSTAPYAYAQLVMAELGSSQPRTLANAFAAPVSTRGDLLANTYGALRRHTASLDEVYGRSTARQLVGVGEVQALREALGAGEARSLADVAAWISAQVRGA